MIHHRLIPFRPSRASRHRSRVLNAVHYALSSLFLRLFWVLCVFSGLLSPLVRAEQFGAFTYTSDGAAITITGYTGAGGAVTIPGEIAGLPVRVIGDSAFLGKANLIAVNLPESVTSVVSSAFFYCPDLISIDVAAANTSYRSVDGVLFDKSLTTLVRYPGGKAGSYAIPSGISAIASYAFLSSTGLDGVTIPEGVASIGFLAFASCSKLTNAAIPESVTLIEGGPFGNCTGLQHIAVASGNQNYQSIDGALFDIGLSTLIQYPAGRPGGYVIPDGVSSIGGDAFNGSFGLTSIAIPGTVTTIRQGAFANCSNLDDMILPEGVVTIEWHAFQGCSVLRNVIIPDSTNTIGGMAFFGCTSLTSVIMGSGVTSIGNEAFRNNAALARVLFEGDAPASFGSNVFDNAAERFTISYQDGSSGFSSPLWMGYPAVVLRIISTTWQNGVVSLMASGGQQDWIYELQRRLDLGASPWATVGTSGPLAADGTVTLSDNTAPPAQAFYRVVGHEP